MAALTILTRFLGELPEENLVEGLADPGEVTVSPLEEVLTEAEQQPAALHGGVHLTIVDFSGARHGSPAWPGSQGTLATSHRRD